MSRVGQFIVIEGVEGAGKSTAINCVTDWLTTQGIKCQTVREPGGTKTGEILRGILKDPQLKHTLDDRTELLLMVASRIQLINEVIKPLLNEGIWVIADRFEWSTMAYQGGGRGLPEKMIDSLSQFALNDFHPDLILFMDIPPELAMQRVKSRGELDRIEREPMVFFNRIYDHYLKLLAHEDRALRIDATQPLADVQKSIIQSLNTFAAACHD